MKKKLIIALVIFLLIVAAYFIIPFIWSAIEIGIKDWVFRMMVKYGPFVVLLIAVGVMYGGNSGRSFPADGTGHPSDPFLLITYSQRSGTPGIGRAGESFLCVFD